MQIIAYAIQSAFLVLHFVVVGYRTWVNSRADPFADAKNSTIALYNTFNEIIKVAVNHFPLMNTHSYTYDCTILTGSSKSSAL
jgi:hypothetical protein